MAEKKRTTKKSTRPTTKNRAVSTPPKKSSNFFSDFFRFGESYSSLVLGIIVVIAVAALLVTFTRSRLMNPENQEQQDISATQTEEASETPVAGSTYVVSEGDDLWSISEKAYGDGYMWNEIAQANNLTNPDNVPAGTELQLPEKETQEDTQPTEVPATATTAPTVATTPVPTGTEGSLTGTSYRVAHGDNLWEIAVRAYGDGYKWVDIARANNLENPDIIHTGNTLNLPR